MDKSTVSSYSARRSNGRVVKSSPPTPLPTATPAGTLVDTRGRPLRDLRISVTDRCNFRCTYCMPKEVFGSRYHFLPQAEVLSFEEIARLAGLFVTQGVHKLRLTGGEPLVRKNVEGLIELLAQLCTPDGEPLDITLTTNGSLLERKAKALAAAGLKRVTVSLDALDDTIFQRMNDVGFPVHKVLAGIDAAQAAGLGPIKVNVVVKRGTNEQEILPIARRFRGTGITVRFIEFMDVGSTNGWRMTEVLPGAEVIRLLQSEFPLVPLEATAPGETAERWGYAGADGRHDPALGEVGVICSVTHPFCGACNRARLSTDGKLYLCLFANHGHDLRALLRGGAPDEAIQGAIAGIWQGRTDRYSELRASLPPDHGPSEKRIEMSYIGG